MIYRAGVEEVDRANGRGLQCGEKCCANKKGHLPKIGRWLLLGLCCCDFCFASHLRLRTKPIV